MAISDMEKKYKSDIDDITNWCETTYKEVFAKYFEDTRRLYDSFTSSSRPISDLELEAILTYLPLNLFAVSEVLANYKSQEEVIRLKIKQLKYDTYQSLSEGTQTARKEAADRATIEDEIFLKAYKKLIERVESEISFSRELIMSAKKIWTARKQTETLGVGAETVPTEDNVSMLPDYAPELD